MPARKKRRHDQPHKVLHLTTYQRLEEYLRAFAQGHFHLLILVGAGGLAKSRSVRAVLDGKACWIEGNATPFGMYAKLYRHRDQFVVIDDVDALYADRSGVRLLKCLCQTEEEKAVAWHSDARSLERQGIPREFTTKSRVVIISNDWKTLEQERGGAPGPGARAALPARCGRGPRAGGEVVRRPGDLRVVRRQPAPGPRAVAAALRAGEGAEGGRHGLDRGAGGRGREPAGPARRRAAGQHRLRQHGGAGQGVRGAGGRMPGDLLQLPPQARRRERNGE